MMHIKIQAGFSLIEAMIALAIFSIALSSVILLQLNSLKLQHDSYLRIIASLAASDMADRMRANAEEASLGLNSAYHLPSMKGTPACLGLDAQGNPNNSSCNAADMAQHDFYEWSSYLAGNEETTWHPAYAKGLPSGAGIVCIDSTPDDGSPLSFACDNTVLVSDMPIYAIKVWWKEGKDNQSTTRRHVLSFSP